MKVLIISLAFYTVILATSCNYYPLNELACVSKTEGVSCQFNFFENACIETHSAQLGCGMNLNKQACLQQITKLDGSEVKCYFGQKCVSANLFHLKYLDCESGFSINACLNLQTKQCIWISNQCKPYEGVVPIGTNCRNIFNSPVSPSLCAQIQSVACYNNGFQGGYFCSEIDDSQLSQFTCDANGLNQIACTSIRTKGQQCIFKGGKCKQFSKKDDSNCLNFLNREACLSITNPSVMCVWSQRGCENYISIEIEKCEDLKNVNPSVCSAQNLLCSYDQQTNSCYRPVKFECDTKGLSAAACLQIQTQQCIFDQIKGCYQLQQEELNLFDCVAQLNELSCLNIQTQSQYCQWTGDKCQRILLSQDTDCSLPLVNGVALKVNGNVCQAISKQNIGCKYDKNTNLCLITSGTETCTTPYLNLFACVQVKSNIACKWNEDYSKCEIAKITDKITKCNDLRYANPIACSQISEITNGSGVGCYYSDGTQQCTVVNSDTLKNMECSQKGLNKYGCTMITKLGQKCRWVRGSCTTIKTKEQIAQVSCLDLQFVNPGTCALATFNSEVCKYKVEALGCVNTINSSDTGDYCDTPGLNSIACQQITRNPNGCYFDKINNICVVAPSGSSSDLAEAAASQYLLSTAKCVGNSPTQNICIAIQTLGQYCSWNSRNSYCENQFVQMNEKCLDYNTVEKLKTNPGTIINVNANVCASIVMNYPNFDPKSTTTPLDPLRGYCQFDGKGNCIKFQVKTCTDPCCGDIVGINAHVCSRYTNVDKYCYFNEYNKCVLLTDDIVDTTQKQAVKDFYNYKQYKCSSMNKNSCTMIDWSPTQQCYWDGKVCTQINYADYPKFTIDIFYPTWLSKYACQGIEGNLQNVRKYFIYDSVNKVCNEETFDRISCEISGINSNICLGRTPNLFCKWDKVNLVCKTIDDYLQMFTCNEYQNRNACINNPYVPCAFLEFSDKCISSPQNINCNDYYSGIYQGQVNPKACANITKPGQICIYNEVSKQCQNAANQTSQTCDLEGINSIGCYQNTQGNCRWDQKNLQCYEEGDQHTIDNLKCSDNVNIQLCKSITIDNCEWSTVDKQCYSMDSLSIINAQSLYNAQACTSLIGNPYYFDSSTYKCVLITDDDLDCTSKILNKQACLLNTKGYKCVFDATQPPEKKCQNFKDEQLICNSTSLINIETCMNIPQACYFDQPTLTCKSTTVDSSLKCSSLIVIGQFFNKIACSSISDTITDTSLDDTLKICTSSPSVAPNAQQCYFEKYCQWDTQKYSCSLVQIGTGSYSGGGQNSGPSCSLSVKKYSCTNIYSRAVCLQFGTDCYFDITQGGCQAYTSNLYKVLNCSQINGVNCGSSKTENAYCEVVSAPDGTDFTPSCEINPTNQNTCQQSTTRTLKSCSNFDSNSVATDCAQANDMCYYDQNCKVPLSTTDGTIQCLSPGVSKSLCIVLDSPCDFSSGSCKPITIPSLNVDKQNYYNVCNEVNYLITNKYEYACGQITTSPCQYKKKSCQNAFYQLCSDLIGFTVSLMACNQCKNLPVIYDYSLSQCVAATNLSTNCDTLTQQTCLSPECEWNADHKFCHINLKKLNKSSCLQLTTLTTSTISIYAQWDNTNNLCVQLSSNNLKQIKDCSILSRKSCLQSSLSCWIDSTTQQCQNFDAIMVGCSEISILQGQSQHCLVSNKEACKWDNTNSKCIAADLTKDDCSVLNKYGCLNMQRNLNCAWSEYDQKCNTLSVTINGSCTQYALGGNANYNKVIPYVCAQIVGNQATCYLDQRTNKCTSVGNKAITCADNVGLNKLACLKSTIDKCKFDDTNKKCLPITSTDNKCDPSLNQVACLSFTDKYCEYYLDKCGDFFLADKVSVAAAIVPLLPGKIISPSVCAYYNQKIPNAYFIYAPVRKFCLNADMPLPTQYFALCDSISISQKVCLEKTMEYCTYTNSQCQSISIDTIRQQTTCNNAYSWKACIAINSLCKFKNGQCVPIVATDTCQSLQADLKVFVGPQVCTQFPTPCKYSSINFNCQAVITIFESCSTLGLSKKACLENTSTSFCLYDAVNNQCTSTYDQTLSCNDTNSPKTWYINASKCYFISTAGNYCKFLNGECLSNSKDQLTICGAPSIKTNPISCQIATNGICYYSPIPNTCNLGDQVTLNAQHYWSTGKSFNKQACIKYNPDLDSTPPEDKVKLIWDDIKGCIELTSADLANISCNSPINRLACVSITNPTQFCQFDTNTSKCKSYDYLIPPENPIGLCASLANVNRFEFCQYASDSCMYNSFAKNCIIPVLDTIKTQIINNSDCFNKGLSKTTCELLLTPPCHYHDIRKLCYGGAIFCENNVGDNCKNVTTEPCNQIADSCTPISFDSLNTISCQDAANLLGCTSITNPKKLCQYDKTNQVCNDLTNLNNKCSTYTFINSSKVCENVSDIACKYDFSSKSCKEVQSTEQFECDRGLNILACLNNTRKSLSCLFNNYCFGPTFGVNQCSDTQSKDVCLNYIYQCTWDESLSQCSNFDSQNQTCDDLKQNQTIVSSQVCYNSQTSSGACMYDSLTNTCVITIPQSCEELQTRIQCINMNDLPCIWENQKCSFKIAKDSDTCSNIANNGSKLSCLAIFRQGQQCQYIDNGCTSFKEGQSESNCLDNINIIACLTQQRDKCYWKYETKQIQTTSLITGSCLKYVEDSTAQCDSKLSYQSCFIVSKIGAFCKWANGECKTISTNTQLQIQYNTYSLVNSNTCGLVNVGKVKYDITTHSCVLLGNETITCKCGVQTVGLNKSACLGIVDEPCRWIDTYKVCVWKGSQCDKF